MTNWADALKLIDVNDMPSASYIGKVYNTEIDTFSELLGINDCPWSNEFYDRMLKHWVTSWVCTDTRVGVAVYCLDKVPVAVSTQPARKSMPSSFTPQLQFIFQPTNFTRLFIHYTH